MIRKAGKFKKNRIAGEFQAEIISKGRILSFVRSGVDKFFRGDLFRGEGFALSLEVLPRTDESRVERFLGVSS